MGKYKEGVGINGKLLVYIYISKCRRYFIDIYTEHCINIYLWVSEPLHSPGPAVLSSSVAVEGFRGRKGSFYFNFNLNPEYFYFFGQTSYLQFWYKHFYKSLF